MNLRKRGKGFYSWTNIRWSVQGSHSVGSQEIKTSGKLFELKPQMESVALCKGDSLRWSLFILLKVTGSLYICLKRFRFFFTPRIFILWFHIGFFISNYISSTKSFIKNSFSGIIFKQVFPLFIFLAASASSHALPGFSCHSYVSPCFKSGAVAPWACRSVPERDT